MKKINSFIIIGGDRRQIYMADYIKSLGYDVFAYGLNQGDMNNQNNLKLEINNKDAIILPLPCTKDDKSIYSSLVLKENIDDIYGLIKPDQPVFAGMISKGLESKFKRKTKYVFDYFKREEVTVMNTVPTVQGILKAIFENVDYTVFSSKCAVFGYGRVSKLTADTLLSLGANVTVCARKPGDLALSETKGCKGCFIDTFYKIAHEYDIIINTVPSVVIDKKILENLKSECLIIDVASAPYGVDYKAAYDQGIKAIQCPSLPGKVAPKTAGKIIADGIINIIKEELDE